MVLLLVSALPISFGVAGAATQPTSSATVDPGAAQLDPGGPVADSYQSGLPAVTVQVQQATSSGGKATIDGWVRYQNMTGGFSPARQTDVILRKRTTLVPENKEIARTTTNESGYYSFEIDVAKWESNVDGKDDTLRLRVQALAQNPAVNVVNFGKNLDTANGNTWTINNDGTIDRGDAGRTFNFSITGKDERRAFQIANWTLEEYRFTKRSVGWTRSRVKARYPAVNNDQAQFKSFLEKFVIGNATWNRSDTRHVIHHEYGHAVMSGLFGYKGWQIPHTSTWFSSHCIWSETHRLTAWYEGWAEFMEAATVDNPAVHEENIETYPYFNDSDSHGGTDCPSSDTGDFDGVTVEGAIANILWDVYDGANEPHDRIDGSLGEVFNAVNETDNKAWGRAFNNGRTRDIHMFFIQYVDNTGRHEALRKIYFEYGINKPDRFEHAPGSGSSCTVAGYPCSKLSGDKWSKLEPNTSVDVGLHHQDDDFYRIELDEEQRATINATVTAKAPDGTGDMRVVVSGSKSSGGNTVGPALGSATESYPHEEVTFTAPDNGTYYIHVYDESSRTGGDLTYDLTVNATPQPPQTFEQDDTPRQATELSPYRIGQFTRTIEQTAATARHDADYFTLTLGPGDRISHASLRDGPGLNLTLQDDAGTTLQTVGNGDVIRTTTDLDGNYFLEVDGDARIDGYTLNVTTQNISQKYEQNDAKTAAADLTQTLDLSPDPARSGGTGPGHRGNPRWCKQTNTGSSTAGSTGGTGIGTGFQGPCPRHFWWDDGRTNPGFGPHEQDWYTLTLQRHERLNVTLPDDRLGVELHANGREVARAAPGSGQRSVQYTAQTAGQVAINVTGDDYVPAHELRFILVDAAARDRFEANDERASATRVRAASSGNLTVREPLLKLASGDADFFAVDLAKGDELNVSVTHLESAGEVRLAVIDPGGSHTIATDPRPQVKTYTTRLERATLTATQAGTYYLKVSGTTDVALKYNLSVTTRTDATQPVVTPIPVPGGDRFEFEGLQTGRWFTRDVPTPEDIARAGMFEEIGLNPDAPIDRLGVRMAVRTELPDGVPALERTSVIGGQYLHVDPQGSYSGTTKVRVRVSRDRLRSADASADSLAVFRHSGADTDGGWERLETTVAEKGENAVVLEAVADGMSVFAVGTVKDTIYDLIAANKGVYNENAEKVPGVFASLFGGERINLEVAREGDGRERIGVAMEGNRIQTVRKGGIDDATLVVETSESTVRTVKNAEQPREEAIAALDDGEISYHGVGIVNTVKFTGVKIAVGVMDFVGETLGIGPFA